MTVVVVLSGAKDPLFRIRTSRSFAALRTTETTDV
jgi:hypothetical protein